MNRLAQTPLLLSATLFLAASLRAADETMTAPAISPPSAGKAASAPPPVTGMKPSRTEELLQRFDTNHDGKLDDDELAIAHETMLKEQMARQAAQAARPDAAEFRARMLAMFDKNHDGRLDDEERAEMRKYAEEHGLGPDGEVRADLMRRFDKNADGKLDDNERAELEKFLAERRTQMGTMREALLRQFDRNGNGRIDDDELPAMEKAVRARLETNPQQLARYDLNGDGKLDDAEWAAAREQILRLVNRPPPAATETDGRRTGPEAPPPSVVPKP